MPGKSIRSIRTVLLITAVVTGLAASGTMWAQQAPPKATPTPTPTPTPKPKPAAPATAPEAEMGRVTGEVVVRARRVEETVQEVPASVTVQSGNQLIEKAVGDFSELAFTAPNTLIQENGNQPARTNVTIRGVPGRTGVYMDDVIVGDGSVNNVMMLDVDRVEVLRGPQGTLFGRNSIAGTINTITSKPSAEAWVADGLVRAGDYGTLYGNATATGPVVKDKFSLSLSAGYGSDDGYEKTVNGEKVNGNTQYAFRGKALFTPTDKLSLTVAGDYHHDDAHVGYGDAVEDFGVLGAFYHHAANSGKPYDRVVDTRNVDQSTDRPVYGLSAIIDWNLGGATLQSITGSRRSDSETTRDGDGGRSEIVIGTQPLEYRSFSQEFRLSGGSKAITWQGGLYYFKDKREFTDNNRLGKDYALAVIPQLAPYVGNPYGIVTIGALYASPLLQQITGIHPTTPYGDRSTYNRNEIESLAGYGSGTWHAGPKLNLTLGLRYTHENIDAAYSQQGIPWALALDPNIPETPLESSDDNWSPLLSVVYAPGQNTSLYGTVSRGYQSGGFNLAPGSATADQREFKPELVTNYEVGLKNTLAGGRLFSTFALFMMQYDDFQRSQSQVTTSGQITTTFNTNATIKGFELELSARPVDGLNLSGGLGYQDSTYDDYKNAPVNTQTGVKIVDLTGETLPFVPNWSGTLSAYYSTPLSDKVTLKLGGDLQYRSDYQVNDGPDPRLKVSDTTNIGAEIGVSLPRIGLELRLRGQNLLDEQFITSLDFNYLAGATISDLNAPRRFFIELRKTFF